MGTIDRSMYVVSRYVRTDNRASPLYATVIQKLTRTRTGVSNPKWREQITNHTNAGTNLSGTFETMDVSTVNGGMKTSDVAAPNGIREYGINGDLCGKQYPKLFTGADITGEFADNLATMKAYKQIRSLQQQFSGGVFVGELRETLSMLRRPAKGILDGLSSYLASLAHGENAKLIKNAYSRKREKGLAARQAQKAAEDRVKRMLSQTWLEGCFGWLPFVNDLEDAVKAYNRLADKTNDNRYEKIRAVGKYSAHVLTKSEAIAPIANFYWLANIKEWQSAVTIIRGEVCIKPEMTKMDVARAVGLDPGSFVPTIWELIPWSFLVDYFAKIGDLLEAQSTDLSGVRWLVRTRIKERYKHVTMRPHPTLNTSALSVWGNQGFVRYKQRTVSRVAPYSLATPSLIFKLPTNPLQQANMLALFTQATSVHPQKFDDFRGRAFRL